MSNKNKNESKDSAEIKLHKRKKRRRILLIIIGILLIVRISLPYIVKNQLVVAVNEVEGYECTIADVDLSIFRGAMIIEEFQIKITNNNVTQPFVAIKESDISVEWNAIFDGAIVGEILLDEPVLYFADGENDSDDQVGDATWVDPILDFIPLRINRFEIKNGGVEFENIVTNPKVNLQLSNLELIATNLTNSKDLTDDLPSNVSFTGNVLNGGNINLSGGINILKELPDLDLDLNIRNVDLKQLNDFTKVYANFDFEKGGFDLASEFAMNDGDVKGYVKPILKDVSVFNLKEKGKFTNLMWQAFIGFAMEITENQIKDQTGTKIPLSGRYENPDVGVFVTIMNIFKNAFIKAYEPKTDGTIQFEDVKSFTKKKIDTI